MIIEEPTYHVVHSDESEINYSPQNGYTYGGDGNFWGGGNLPCILLEQGDLPTDMAKITINYYFAQSYNVNLVNFEYDPIYFPVPTSLPKTLIYTEVQAKTLGDLGDNGTVNINYTYYGNLDNLIANDRSLGTNQQPPPIDPNQDARAFAESVQQYWITVEVSKINKPLLSSM